MGIGKGFGDGGKLPAVELEFGHLK
jgi:hypothetical protein